MKSDIQIILASQSRIRKQLLEEAGLKFKVIVSEADETPDENKNFQDQLAEIAWRKAMAVFVQTKDQGRRLILAGDQNIIFENKSWGKPANIKEGRELIGRMRGTDEVYAYNGNAIILADKDKILQSVNLTDIAQYHIDNISDEELENYLKTKVYLTLCGGISVTDGGFVHRIKGRDSTARGLTLEYALEILNNL